jgi:SAM-dependent methyltransferase
MNANAKEARKITPIVTVKEPPPLPVIADPGTADRAFDRTFLGTQQHGRMLHRDYSAHFFRWSFARRHIPVGSTVVDVGCGPELPLFHVLSLSPSWLPSSYIGVDLNRLANKPARAWAKVVDRFDFTARWAELPKNRDAVVAFEVVEHMPPEAGVKLLKGCHAILRDGGTLLLSTPVYNGKQARNHLHEYEIDELQAAIEGAGFTVERRFGTFMSAKEIAHAEGRHQAVYGELREYYDNDAMACFLAPLYPDLARNNLWVCRK